MLKLEDDDNDEYPSLNLEAFAKGYEETDANCSIKLKTAYQARIKKLEASLTNKNLSPSTKEAYSLELRVLQDAITSTP